VVFHGMRVFWGCQKRCDLGQLGQASRGRAVTSHGLVLGQPGNGWMDRW